MDDDDKCVIVNIENMGYHQNYVRVLPLNFYDDQNKCEWLFGKLLFIELKARAKNFIIDFIKKHFHAIK